MEIYTTTDSNEIRAIVEGRIPKCLIHNYDFPTDRIYLRGYAGITITNIPLSDSMRIQKKMNLKFFPCSVINCFNKRQKTDLIKKLVGQGLFVAVSDNGNLEHYFTLYSKKRKKFRRDV